MLTVVLATHNGSGTLPRMLESLTNLKAPQGGWKLVIVDNGSVDDTQQVLRQFESALPLTTIYEPQRGKNRALNAALFFTEGDLVVFTDDDIIADPQWLVRMRVAADQHPDVSLFGGEIRPAWDEQPPDWVWDSIPIPIVYAITGDRRLGGPTQPGSIWGPNMAVRKRIFELGHSFDETVGPAPGQYRMGSETEFTIRVGKLGHQSWYVAGAVVYHIIRPHQLLPSWIASRGYRFGRDMYWKENDVRLSNSGQGARDKLPKLFGFPRYYFRLFAEAGPRVIAARLRGDKAAEVRHRWELAYWRGYFGEAWRCRRP